jgi:hypothetical protein
MHVVKKRVSISKHRREHCYVGIKLVSENKPESETQRQDQDPLADVNQTRIV